MPPTILVVDDEPAVRDLVSGLLEDEGYTVHTAPDGLAALETVAHDTRDLVLTNLSMPGLDGAGLIAQLRREWPTCPSSCSVRRSGSPLRPGCHSWPSPSTSPPCSP